MWSHQLSEPRDHQAVCCGRHRCSQHTLCLECFFHSWGGWSSVWVQWQLAMLMCGRLLKGTWHHCHSTYSLASNDLMPLGKKNCKPISVNDFVSINASLFALRGVILHHGSDSLSGHYTSCIKTSDNQWIHCNDAHVRQCQMLKWDIFSTLSLNFVNLLLLKGDSNS